MANKSANKSKKGKGQSGKKAQTEKVQGLDGAIDGLLQNTSFVRSTDAHILTRRRKVRTPLEAVNIILGGGVPMGVICQAWGRAKAGKSIWMYLMMANFLRENPEHPAFIIDTEASADDERLEYLGVDTSRVYRLYSPSIEEGFQQLLKIIENKEKNPQLDIPIFSVWDTITKGKGEEGSKFSRMAAMERARVIKNYTNEIFAKIEQHEMIFGVINQVIQHTDGYGNTHLDTGGGVGLKHDIHLSAYIYHDSDIFADGTKFLMAKKSYLNIDKSKISPEFYKVPVIIDIARGGIIDEHASFVLYLLEIGMVSQNGGWYNFEPAKAYLGQVERLQEFAEVLEAYSKNCRYGDLIENVKQDPKLYLFLRIVLLDYIGSFYKLQAQVMEDYRLQLENELRDLIGENK